MNNPAKPSTHRPVPGPLMVDVAGTVLTDEDRSLLAHPDVGAAIIFTRNYADRDQLARLVADMRAARANLLIVADYEGGRVQRFRDGFTRLPAMRTLGHLYESAAEQALATAREIGWLIASELATVGIDMPFAPVVDLDYGASGVIGDRAFTGDPSSTAKLAGALAAGLIEGGSAATAKHFPGHGHVAADSHAELPIDDRTLAEMANDMAPYRTLIEAGLASVMMAHVRYPDIDDLPASLSPLWIDDILRQRVGFNGCVFCDDLSMGGAAVIGDYAERARLALAAGCDYLPVCNNRPAVLDLLGRVAASNDQAANRRQALHDLCVHDQPADRSTLEADPRWQAASALIDQLSAAG